MVTLSDGHTVGKNASWTTCDNPHAGYHMKSKTFEVRPNDKIIARKVTVYLGPLAIFYLPVLVISLVHEKGPPRTSFLPLFGYDQAEGFWVRHASVSVIVNSSTAITGSNIFRSSVLGSV